MRIRAKTFKEWLKANFTKAELKDVVAHGADSGFYGLIYYRDTTKLYQKYKDELWDHLIEESKAYGHDNPFEFLASFNGAKNIDDAVTMENLIIWYAAESFANEIIESY